MSTTINKIHGQRSNSFSEYLTSSPEILREALSNLNLIIKTINQLGSNEDLDMKTILHSIATSSNKLIQNSTTAIYLFDPIQDKFSQQPDAIAGDIDIFQTDTSPRQDGFGRAASSQRRKFLSYEDKSVPIHPELLKSGIKSMGCFPMVILQQSMGVFYIYLNEDRKFNDFELLMLENFVDQAAIAIHHNLLQENIRIALDRKEDEITRLHRAGLLISSRPRLNETLEAILQMALEVTSAHYGCFRLVDNSGSNLVIVAIAGDSLSDPLTDNLPLDTSSVMGWVAKHRQPLYIPDVKLHPWSSIYYPLDSDLEIRSELAVPLIGASGRLEGVLNLESPVVNNFGEQDSHLLQAFATQAVIAIQEISLLDALQEVSERLLIEPYQQVLKRLTELACDLLNATDSAIWTLENQSLIIRAASSDYLHGVNVPLDGSMVGKAILDRCPIISTDVQNDPLFYRPDISRNAGWTQALVVPLLSSAHSEQDPVGAFTVFSTRPDTGHFTESEWDKKVLTILAHYAALAVQNAARQDALRNAQNQQAVTETFAALGDISVNLLHQINNKFGTIPVRIEGIQDKCQTALNENPYLAANLAEIEKSAREAMNVVRYNMNFLNPINPTEVKLSDCVRDAIRTVNHPPGIHIITKDLEDLPRVLAGKQSLVLVFINLLENAIHAMNGMGDITIQGIEQQDSLEITVSDTGPGIDPELHKRIFELSYSGDTPAGTGKLGFGLWWVKTLMTRLGGHVRVESDGHSGTTFCLMLPKVDASHIVQDSTK
jgi:GAF domain-containing protein/anti-sigma regulatory factor (Ser/Thr protein kinase)